MLRHAFETVLLGGPLPTTTHLLTSSSNTLLSQTPHASYNNNNITIPEWIVHFHEFRRSLFLKTVEPAIVFLLGPVQPEDESSGCTGAAQYNHQTHDTDHRRLGFLPEYVKDVSYYQETSMSFASFSMLFFVLGCLMLVFLSCFYHNQKTSPLFISPRRHRLPKLVPPPLPVDGFFSWVRAIFFMADEEIINRVGYDALIFLRFHRLALRCIVKMSFFSFLILLPMNFTGGGHVNANEYKEAVGKLLVTDFLRFTMANVSNKSRRLWVHCFAAYLLTAIVVKELLVEYNAFSHIRHRYLLSREPHLRTVLVTNIPRHLRTANKITTYFRHVYPEAVKSVTISQNVIWLEKLVAQRNAILTKIERELLLLCRREKRKLVGLTLLEKLLMMVTSKVLCTEVCQICDGPQERLAKLYSQLEELNDLVEKEQKRRRRVMKRIDTMEAEHGNHDIDYILASPFVSDAAGLASPRRMEDGGGMADVPPPGMAAARSPSVGAPRNPDGSIERRNLHAAGAYQPPTLFTAGQAVSQGGLAPSLSKEVKWDPNVGSYTDASGQPVPAPTEATVEGAPAATTQEEPMDWTKQKGDKPRSTRSRSTGSATTTTTTSHRPFQRAKLALRRYSSEAFFSKKKRRYPHAWSPGNRMGSAGFASGGAAEAAMGKGSSRPDYIEDHTNEVCDKAFVLMRTFTASTIAMQSMHSSKPGSMSVNTAPEPRDILWNNIYISKGAKRTRSFLGEVLVFILITFYVFPVALVSLLVSESALISFSPRLAQLDRASAFFSSAIGMVQPICLVGIQQLMPPFLMQIGKAEGHLAFSEVQMRTFSRYFSFQVLNIFLVTAIAGSVFDALATILAHPEAAFEMLGNQLPRMSSFFVTFVIMKTFVGLGVELVRTIAIVQGMFRYVLFPNSTLRQQRSVRVGMRAIDDPGWFPFHKILAQDMLVVVISVVFAVVAPLVLIPCALFYFCSRILWTHHHLFVFESVFETGGQFWPKIFRRFVFGLIISQATITGQFLLKEAQQEAIATIILMFLTYTFLRSTRARYDATSSALPLEVATIMDISISQEEESFRRRQNVHTPHHGPISPPRSLMSPAQEHGNKVVRNGHRHHLGGDAEDRYDMMPGTNIGQYDPFEHAYVQPVLRASARARPEQPFPPSQLGREEVFMGQRFAPKHASNLYGEREQLGQGATVKLKSLNKQDRQLIDRWWNDQLQRAGEQRLFSVLIGEESGTLVIGRRANLDFC